MVVLWGESFSTDRSKSLGFKFLCYSSSERENNICEYLSRGAYLIRLERDRE